MRDADDDTELLETACRAAPATGDGSDDDDDAVAAACAAEGVTLAPTGLAGIVGRRADGSLVSKHDARLDGYLKARALGEACDFSGDLTGARVPPRAFHGLVAFQRKVSGRVAAAAKRPTRRSG